MSYFPTGILSQVRPESWPPAHGRNTPTLMDDDFTDDDELDLPLLQRDPLSYFLTPPTPQLQEFEFEFNFDAGIEDANNPQEVVRSVSPSTLDGHKKYRAKGRGSDCAILDDEDSDGEEDYIRYRPSKSSPLGFPDFGLDRPKSPGATPTKPGDGMLSPNSFHVGSPRGRPVKSFSPPRRPLSGRSRSLPLQRQHSWREPDADVWSIEEEPEKETLSERGLSTEDLEAYFKQDKTLPMQIPDAKPKKKVRFVLPSTDSFH